MKNIEESFVGMYSLCGFDCFTDTYCIDRSLVCDRFQNCPNNVDEAQCDYSRFFLSILFFVKNLISIDIHRPPISFQSKVILLTVLLMMISFDVFSILICYFCCGISSRNRLDVKEQKSTSRPFQRAFEILFILYI